ncbi:MAG: hypothetical protein LBN36_01760 [Clostridiales Family XIII bacterium]|nr:hypothetical protein [Clostridiales Family XIII bacterium]
MREQSDTKENTNIGLRIRRHLVILAVCAIGLILLILSVDFVYPPALQSTHIPMPGTLDTKNVRCIYIQIANDHLTIEDAAQIEDFVLAYNQLDIIKRKSPPPASSGGVQREDMIQLFAGEGIFVVPNGDTVRIGELWYSVDLDSCNYYDYIVYKLFGKDLPRSYFGVPENYPEDSK